MDHKEIGGGHGGKERIESVKLERKSGVAGVSELRELRTVTADTSLDRTL